MVQHNHREYVEGCYRCELSKDEVICGVYRHSPAGRAAPDVPWVDDRCEAPRNESGLCDAHEEVIFGM